MSGVGSLAAMIRRILSLAPLRPFEAITLIVSGIALWGFVLTAPSNTLPAGSGPLLTALSLITLGRGVLGLSGIAAVVHQLLGPRGWPGNRVPRNEAEIAEVVAKKRLGWEFYAVAGWLIVNRAKVEPQYLDHEMRYRAASAEFVPDDKALDYIQDALDEVQRHINNMNAAASRELQERAYGAPGQPGDPVRIQHLADRWSEYYSGLLEWAARLRSTRTSPTYRPVFDALTRLVDLMIDNYRAFVDEYVHEVNDKMTAAIKNHGTWQANVNVQIAISDEALEGVSAEIERLGGHPVERDDREPDRLDPADVRNRIIRQGAEAPQKQSERQAIQRDARQIAKSYRAMSRFHGIDNMDAAGRMGLLDRVMALQRRRDDYAAKWMVQLADPATITSLTPPVTPDWLEAMARDADAMVWQLDHEDGGSVRAGEHTLAAAGRKLTCTCGRQFDTGPEFRAHARDS